jgi:hypothetical protein
MAERSSSSLGLCRAPVDTCGMRSSSVLSSSRCLSDGRLGSMPWPTSHMSMAHLRPSRAWTGVLPCGFRPFESSPLMVALLASHPVRGDHPLERDARAVEFRRGSGRRVQAVRARMGDIRRRGDQVVVRTYASPMLLSSAPPCRRPWPVTTGSVAMTAEVARALDAVDGSERWRSAFV